MQVNLCFARSIPIVAAVALIWSTVLPVAHAADFAVLGGAAVTCTDSILNGAVGLANPGTITQTSCTIGSIHEGNATAQTAYDTFLASYAALAAGPPCDFANVPLGGASLAPGVYCYDAAVTETGTMLTLNGACDDTWIFRIGTTGTGALTGTNFAVLHPNCPDTCSGNVQWWTAQAATLTDSLFRGSIFAGADITATNAIVNGQLLAGGTGTSVLRTGAVTVTDTLANQCPTPAGEEPPPQSPVFVVGDVDFTGVGDVVYFWGAQWWKNNDMSGAVSPGVASFKGYATQANLQCGGTWQSLPGNSSQPPATLPNHVLVVVTSSVLKQGPNISGMIEQIAIVDHDGQYGPNPGHAGRGEVTAIICAQP